MESSRLWEAALLLVGIVQAWFWFDRKQLGARVDELERWVKESIGFHSTQREHARHNDDTLARLIEKIDQLTEAVNDLRMNTRDSVKLADCTRMHRELIDSVRE